MRDGVERRYGHGHKKIRAWDAPGRGSASDVFVLVHGLGVSSDLFRAVAERLRDDGRVIVVDLPGFGGVPHPRRPLSIPEFGRLVDSLLEELDVRDPVLVGHSMGAQVVVAVAARRRSPNGRLVLIGPVVAPAQRSVPWLARHFVRSCVHERFGSAMVSVRGYLTAGLRWPLEIVPSMVKFPIERRIEGLGGRLVIVRGEHDEVCPHEWAEELLARSGARGEVVVAAGASHQVIVDHAAIVEEAVLAVARGNR